MKVGEIMTRDLDRIHPSEPAKKAAQMMKEDDIGALPVFDDDDNLAIGLLTDRDLTQEILAEDRDPETTVHDIMHGGVICCGENDSAEEAARIMQENQIRRLLVKDDSGKISGIISLGDLTSCQNEEVIGEALRGISEPARKAT